VVLAHTSSNIPSFVSQSDFRSSVHVSRQLRMFMRYTRVRNKGNPNCGKSCGDIPHTPTSFEEMVRRLKLSEKEYRSSIPLKEWAQKQRQQVCSPRFAGSVGNRGEALSRDIEVGKHCIVLAHDIHAATVSTFPELVEASSTRALPDASAPRLRAEAELPHSEHCSLLQMVVTVICA
jgi:hypothetical protein